MHARLSPLMFVALAGALVGSGCVAEPEPIVTMDLRTDYVPGVQFVSVVTEVALEGGEPTTLSDVTVARTTEMLPSFRAGQALDGLESGANYQVTVRLVDAGGTEVDSQRRNLTVGDEGVGLIFEIFRACADVTCGSEEVCAASGVCVDEGSVCLGGDPECVGVDGCVADAECTGGFTCDTASCVEGQCLYVTNPAVCGDDAVCAAEGCGEPPVEVPVPIHRSPADNDFVGSPLVTGEERIGGRPKLVWGSTGESYEVRVYVCNPGTECEDAPVQSHEVSESFWCVAPDLGFGRYGWQVQARVGEATSDWSALTYFWVAERNDTNGD
ncbi:MAG: hypothetical protein AB8I08_28445, partial [Sandaracinaceae bacterium]